MTVHLETCVDSIDLGALLGVAVRDLVIRGQSLQKSQALLKLQELTEEVEVGGYGRSSILYKSGGGKELENVSHRKAVLTRSL